MGGFTTGPIVYDKTEATKGVEDFWVIKLGCPPIVRLTHTGDLDLCTSDSVKFMAFEVSGGKYQWYKDNIIIPGATGITYTAKTVGRYKYTVSVDSMQGCINTSASIPVTNSCSKTTNNLTIYPNPSKGIIIVTYKSETAGNVQLLLLDRSGKVIYSSTKYASKGVNTYKLNLPSLINGIYNLHLIKGETQNSASVIIQK